MQYKAIIFDLDGTILDTLEDLSDSLNFSLKTHGFPERTLKEARRFVGNGIGKLVERGVPVGTSSEKTAQVLETFKIYYGEHCKDKTKPYEGIPQLLRDLRNAGFRTAVVSNKADFAVQKLCEDFFPGCFDAAAGEKEGIRRKPAPDSVFSCMKKLQVTAEESLYVGDSEVDIATAANAAMDSCIVTWGFRDRDYLAKCGAVNFADTVDELKNFIIR